MRDIANNSGTKSLVFGAQKQALKTRWFLHATLQEEDGYSKYFESCCSEWGAWGMTQEDSQKFTFYSSLLLFSFRLWLLAKFCGL